jgi:outer membrane receptor protein involved in Fe transport
VYTQDFKTDVQEPAAFGEVSFQPTEALKLTGGLRWYEVKTSIFGYEEGMAAGGGPAIITPPETTTEHGINPKVEADYHITPDEMVYATAAKGFRPGGVVPIVPAGQPGTSGDCAAALARIEPGVSLAGIRSFKSDSLWSYEVGTKTAWLDHRLTANAAMFYIKWKDIQQQIFLSCGFPYTTNAGAAESKGGEIELHALAMEHLELSLGMGYQDAKITQSSNTSPQQVGSPVYQVPDWTGNVSAAYTTALTERWKLVSGADYSYIGRSFSGNNNPSNPRLRPSYRLIDARLSLSKGPFEIALVGKNLANEVANLGDNRSIAAELAGRPRLFVNQPRTLGIEIRQSF